MNFGDVNENRNYKFSTVKPNFHTVAFVNNFRRHATLFEVVEFKSELGTGG